MQPGHHRQRVSTHPSSASGPVDTVEMACHHRETSKPQRQCVQMPPGSVLIPGAFTLSWQLTPQSRSQAGQLADKEPHRRAMPGSFACMGQALPHAVHLHRQIEPCGLDLTSSLQAPQVLGNQRGKTTLSKSKGSRGAFFPYPDVHI